MQAPGVWLKSVCVGMVVSGLMACSPAPRLELTAQQKETDLKDIYAVFERDYAPLDYKQKLKNFSWDELKDRTLRRAAATQSNSEYYRVVYEFVAQLSDAHTTASVTDSALPARTEVAYLGFTGKRKKDDLQVTELLPTFRGKESYYPIKTGDIVIKLNGKTLKEYVDTEALKFRDLGDKEANYTYHFPKLFNRSSTTQGVPTENNAQVTVKRGDKELTLNLPWVKKDLLSFLEEQAKAKALIEKAKEKQKEKQAQIEALSRFVMLPNGDSDEKTTPELSDSDNVFDFAKLILEGKIDLTSSFVDKLVPGKKDYRVWNSFVFWDPYPNWDANLFYNKGAAQKMGLNLPKEFVTVATPLEEFQKERTIQENVIWLPKAKTFPVYVSNEAELDKEGKKTGKTRLMATLYLNTFSPSGNEDDVVKEVAASLKNLQANGVDDVIVDLINNGGGSISLGMRLAALFSQKELQSPLMEFGINEDWLDSLESDSVAGASDAEKEVAERTFQLLRSQIGKRVSTRVSVDEIMPFQKVSGNTDLTRPLRVVLMINEMCASMCDIFSAVMQDNGLAKVVGTKSMGAGGNVVRLNHPSTVGKVYLSQTQSLMVRSNGNYIENVGVTPDVEVPVNESAVTLYTPVRDKAVQTLFSLNP